MATDEARLAGGRRGPLGDALCREAMRGSLGRGLRADERASRRARTTGELVEKTVAPLSESLKRVNDRVEGLDRARASRTAPAQQLELLDDRTRKLATALRSPHVARSLGRDPARTDPRARRHAEHCDFVDQASTRRPSDGGSPGPGRASPGRQERRHRREGALRRVRRARGQRRRGARSRGSPHHARQVRDHVQEAGPEGLLGAVRRRRPTSSFMFLPDETRTSRRGGARRRAFELGVRARRPSSPRRRRDRRCCARSRAAGSRRTRREDARAVHEVGVRAPRASRRMAGHLAKVGRGLDSAVARTTRPWLGPSARPAAGAQARASTLVSRRSTTRRRSSSVARQLRRSQRRGGAQERDAA